MCQAQELAWRRCLHSLASAEVPPEQDANLDAERNQAGWAESALEEAGSHAETRHRQERSTARERKMTDQLQGVLLAF